MRLSIRGSRLCQAVCASVPKLLPEHQPREKRGDHHIQGREKTTVCHGRSDEPRLLKCRRGKKGHASGTSYAQQI
jgi:hypothetical protein